MFVYFSLPRAWLFDFSFFRVISFPRFLNLSMSVSVCLSVCLSLSLLISLSVYLSLYLFVCSLPLICHFQNFSLKTFHGTICYRVIGWVCCYWTLFSSLVFYFLMHRPANCVPSFSYNRIWVLRWGIGVHVVGINEPN